MRKHVVLVIILAVAAMLQGCVRSQLLRQETQAFAKTADEAAAAGTKFYRDLIDSDRDLYATVYMFDASCRPPSIAGQMYLLTSEHPEAQEDRHPDASKGKHSKGKHEKTSAGEQAKASADKSAETPERLCADQAGPDTRTLVQEFSYDSFEREFAALAFISSYVGALAELAADPEATASKQFADAAADLNTLLAAANREPALSKDQIEALGSLSRMLADLSSNARSAREIRALLAARNADATNNFEQLSEGLFRDSDFIDTLLKNKVALAVNLIKFSRSVQPFERHAVLTGYYKTIDTQRNFDAIKKKCKDSAKPDASKYCGAAAAGLMHAAAQAHTDLLNLAAGNLNAEQKAKEARLAYARFIGAVRLFVSLTAAF